VPDKIHKIALPCRCARQKLGEVAEALKRFLAAWGDAAPPSLVPNRARTPLPESIPSKPRLVAR
jgi:hypothetical protein